MLKKLRLAVGLHIQRQPVLLPAVAILLICMSALLQQLLQRGYDRALSEQSATNMALIHAIEESVTLSIQAISGSLSLLSHQVPALSEKSLARIEQEMLHSFPQLHSIDVVPLSDAVLCQSEATSLNASRIQVLPPPKWSPMGRKCQ